MAFFIYMKLILPILLILALIAGCTKNELTQPLEYTGPQSEGEQVELYYSEDQIVRVRLLADLIYEFTNGDREFPKGLYLEFFDETGKLESTLRANHAYYYKKEDQWKAVGKVEVVNLEKNEQLNTEELFWRPAKKDLFTESFVTIRLQNEVIFGEGLEAKQDMSEYTIKKPQGEFTIQEEQ
jgi:LPS export ABC transporter protein LptC